MRDFALPQERSKVLAEINEVLRQISRLFKEKRHKEAKEKREYYKKYLEPLLQKYSGLSPI